jgi:hypothetical protein
MRRQAVNEIPSPRTFLLSPTNDPLQSLAHFRVRLSFLAHTWYHQRRIPALILTIPWPSSITTCHPPTYPPIISLGVACGFPPTACPDPFNSQLLLSQSSLTMASIADDLPREEIEMQPPGCEPPQRDSRSFIEKKVQGVVRAVRSVDECINTSTFGRIFRLKGSGHVSQWRADNSSWLWRNTDPI